MIVETAILSLAAIIVASLATANAIHKRFVGADPNAEVRRILERARAYDVLRRDNQHNSDAVRTEGLRGVQKADEALLKLARGEFQVPQSTSQNTTAPTPSTAGEPQGAQRQANTAPGMPVFGVTKDGVDIVREPKGTNPWPEGQRSP